MEKSWICRDYQPGDEWLIIRLFKQVFRQNMRLKFWRWRFVDNPSGKGIIKLMFDRDKLVGHYAVIPVQVLVSGTSHKAVFALTTMTHPEYFRRGIFAFLAKEAWNHCERQGFNFVYGFPNENAYPILTEKLCWEKSGSIIILQKVIKEEPDIQPTAINIQRVKRFDNKLDLLWERVKGGYSVIVPRVANYLNWRFVQNPDVQYEKYIFKDRQGQILGYIVLKQYILGDVKKGHIVDMLSINDKDIIRVLLRHACAYFYNRQIIDVSAWIPVNTRYYAVMKEEGFTEAEGVQNFGVRMFDKAMSSVKTIVPSLNNWYLTMGDSDVF